MFVTRPQLQRANDLLDIKEHNPNQFELDIVGIPAIGADAETTWGETAQSQWLGPRLHADFPKARVLLWDHLTSRERTVEPDRDEHFQDSDAYQDAGRRFSQMLLHHWADRFLEGLEAERMKAPQGRPIVFICHSTGGIVLKEALCRRRSSALVEACLGITFFATPHHGSNVLALAACADTIKERLKLKWPLGSGLREQLAPQSPYLELLNQRFSAMVPGIEIWSYCEEGVLALEVRTELLPHKFRSKKKLKLSDPVVDKRSAWMTTNDNAVFVEEEIMLHISANHVTLPRLEDDEDLQEEYLAELGKLTTEKNAKDRAVNQKLISFIHENTNVSIYEFYNEVGHGFLPVGVIPPHHVKLNDFLDSNFRLGLAVDAPSSEGPGLIVTDMGDFPFDPPMSATSPTIDKFKETFPSRGRADRLQVTNETSSSRRLSQSRVISRSRSRSRSVQVDGQFLKPSRGAPQTMSSQYLDSILLSGSSATPQKTAPFTWIHTPFCVSSWVPQVMSVIAHKKRIPTLHRKLLAREQWMTHHNRARHAASHAQYVRSHFQSLLAEESNTTVVPGLPPPPSADNIPDKIQFALFIPFLHWDTFAMQEQRSNIIKLRDKQENTRYVDPGVLDGTNLEHHVLWQYLLSESPVHSRRSLDQYGYPALRNTEVRDADQVLFKKTRSHNQEQAKSPRLPRQRLAARLHFAKSSRHKSESAPRPSERPPTVLTVDTLWLWVLRHDTLVTFASKREPDSSEDPKLSRQADLAASIYHAARQDKLKDCYDLAALIVNKCVTTLLDEANDPHLQVFHIFEEYLSDLTEDYTRSFKNFRNLQRTELGPEDMADDLMDLDPMDTYASRKDLYHLFELRDITDELTTIRKLLTEQHRHVGTMRDEFRTRLRPLEKGTRALELLAETLDALDAYVEAVDTMLKSSDAMQKSYEKLLDMKTAKVNVDEAHASRKQTEVSTEQSKAVTIFTIVTIVFSPLSFMSSLFGMNVSEWSGVASNPDLYVVLRVLVGVSLAVIIVALLVAFNRFTRALVYWSWEWLAWLAVLALDLVGLGWLPSALHNGFIRLVSRLPRNPFAQHPHPRAPPTPLSNLSRTSTIAINKADSAGAEPDEKGKPSFWRRKLRQSGDASEFDDDIELAKDESPRASGPGPRTARTGGGAEATGGTEGFVSSGPAKRRVPTFGDRAPRRPAMFNPVSWDRGGRAGSMVARAPTA